MIYIKKNQINEVKKGIIYNLNYPSLECKVADDNILIQLNEDIYYDVEIFKEIIGIQTEFEYGNLNKNIVSEYEVHINNEDIMSISIEFSQIVGLYSISYINAYNYDFKEDKYITLKDIFKDEAHYTNILDEKIVEQLEYILDEYCYYSEEIEGFVGISKDHTFYIESDFIVICFSSYEFDKLISTPIEVKIRFSEIKEYLSEYVKDRIYKSNI